MRGGAGLAGLCAFALASCRSPAPPPVLGTVPPFALTDQRGRTVTLDQMKGRPWVADFIFTRCAGTCPVMTGALRTLQRQLPTGFGLVSFTVDPARDTPEVLADYAGQVGAGAEWLFLTGSKEALYSLATGGFKLAAYEVPPGEAAGGDGPFLHSSRFVLVDGQGRIRGYYDSTDPEAMRRLAADAAQVQ